MSLKLLSEGDIARELDGVEASVYQYTANTNGIRLFIGLGVALLVGAALAAWWKWGVVLWMVGAALAASAGGWLLVFVTRWQLVLYQRFVALTDTHLIVGTPKSAWQIGWELLDREAMGFEGMASSRLTGQLDIKVAGQEIPLYLFHPVAYIADLQGLIGGLLMQIDPEAYAAAMAAEEAGDVDGDGAVVLRTDDEGGEVVLEAGDEAGEEACDASLPPELSGSVGGT